MDTKLGQAAVTEPATIYPKARSPQNGCVADVATRGGTRMVGLRPSERGSDWRTSYSPRSRSANRPRHPLPHLHPQTGKSARADCRRSVASRLRLTLIRIGHQVPEQRQVVDAVSVAPLPFFRLSEILFEQLLHGASRPGLRVLPRATSSGAAAASTHGHATRRTRASPPDRDARFGRERACSNAEGST